MLMNAGDETRTTTILKNVDNLAALAAQMASTVKAAEAAGDPVPASLLAIVDKLILTAQSLQQQLHLISTKQ